MEPLERQVYARIAELMGYNSITKVVDSLYGIQPGSTALAYIPMYTRDWHSAKKAADKLFDTVSWLQAEDGSYAGTFGKGDQSVDVTAVQGPMLFCEAIIQFYGLGMEIEPAQEEPKHVRGKRK